MNRIIPVLLFAFVQAACSEEPPSYVRFDLRRVRFGVLYIVLAVVIVGRDIHFLGVVFCLIDIEFGLHCPIGFTTVAVVIVRVGRNGPLRFTDSLEANPSGTAITVLKTYPPMSCYIRICTSEHRSHTEEKQEGSQQQLGDEDEEGDH